MILVSSRYMKERAKLVPLRLAPFMRGLIKRKKIFTFNFDGSFLQMAILFGKPEYTF